MVGHVIVTGAGGLIGGPTVAALSASGFRVTAFSRSGPVNAAHETIAVDLLDPAARVAAFGALGATHLVHLAWHGGTADRLTAPDNHIWAAATQQLAADFAAAGGRRAVFAGSCAEYDWSSPILHESTLLAPGTAYGKAKADAGQWLVAHGPELGLSLAWARIFFCYGPNEPKGRLLGDLLSGLLGGTPVECTDGLQERDFLHTSDIGRALASILTSDLEGPVNVASGRATPVRDLIGMTAELAGRPDLVRLGARPRPEGDPPRLVADVSRLASTGFRPALDLAAGLADIVGTALREVRPGDGNPVTGTR